MGQSILGRGDGYYIAVYLTYFYPLKMSLIFLSGVYFLYFFIWKHLGAEIL